MSGSGFGAQNPNDRLEHAGLFGVFSIDLMQYFIKHDPNATAIYDRNMVCLACSDRYLQDYGVSEEQVIGKNHYEVFPEMPQKWRDVHQRALHGFVERNALDWFTRPDGSICVITSYSIHYTKLYEDQ